MTIFLAAEPDGAYLLWGFILLGAAIALFLLEIIVPTGGVLGLLTGVAAIGSVIAFFMYDTTLGVIAIAGYCILAPIVLVFGLKLWASSPLAKRFILGGEQLQRDRNSEAALFESERARQDRLAELRRLIGAEGEAVTPLRPVGFVKIDGRRIDAMADGAAIDAGTPVVVIDVYDNQIKVRPRQ
jgi:membrane-bound serine protease (ClpP class)